MYRLALIIALVIGSLDLSAAKDPPLGLLTPEDFLTLHTDLAKCPEEPWRTIPWKTSVVEGQRIAAVEGKPIFIWAMDGHPLGCT